MRLGTMHLGAFFNPTGHHVASWRHPQAQADAGVSIGHYREIARTAERGLFDLIFLADALSVRDAPMEALSRSAQYVANFEPLTLLAALSGATERIGLVATATTSYNEPYHVARKFASLDHLSGGRAGWNVVTSSNANEAFNFGRDAHFAHAERYARAHEFVDVVKGLWDSWDDDAFPRDKVGGRFFRPEGLHALNHRGTHFSVAGPLNIPRPPQGHPVIVQAGGSEAGMELAARQAEVVFSAHLTLDAARRYAEALRARMGALGRAPGAVRILPGISPVVGRTDSEAEEKFAALQELTDPVVAREILSTALGNVDLSAHPLDGPLPEIPLSDQSQSVPGNIVAMARAEGLTIRQTAMRVAGARGKSTVRGTAATIADRLEEWFAAGAADGFNIMPPYLPGALDDFVNLVVPELQRRGLFRRAYEGRTLREHLGLARPESRHASAAAATA